VGKSKKPTEPRWPQQKMGKRCGYTLNEDGSIEVAPLYSDEMQQVMRAKKVVDELIASTLKAGDALLHPLIERQERVWDDMFDDYGLNRDDGWQLKRGTLSRVQKRKD
jgi:hypothetical protein